MMFDPFASLRKTADGFFSPALKRSAQRSLIRARFAMMHVPAGMQNEVHQRIKKAYAEAVGYKAGFESVSRISAEFSSFKGVCDLHLSADDVDQKKAADNYSQSCHHLMLFLLRKADEKGLVKTLDDRESYMQRIYDDLVNICVLAKVPPPELKKNPTEQEYASACRRMICPRWWERNIRREHGRWVESVSIKNGFVGKSVGQPYVSHDALERYRSRRRRNRDILSKLEVYSAQLDLALDLTGCVESSVSNPENRRNEMMLRIRGLEEWANAKCWGAQFWTVTAPTRFHRWNVQQTGKNQAYDGQSPRQAQEYLCKVWARVRAELKRRGIEIAGVRIAEPHHDGCPHWHLLVFGSGEALRCAKSIMSKHLIDQDPESTQEGQLNRVRYGFRADDIDPERGSAAGYIAKYVSKHIDGTGMKQDEKDKDSDLFLQRNEYEAANHERPEAIDRILAWASLWGIRQFQFFAAGAVTVWRELRRIEKSPINEPIAEAWQAANNEEHGSTSKADWRAFVDSLESFPVHIITFEKDTYYGDTQQSVIGLECGGVEYMTHETEWEIRSKKRSENMDAWTCDNNCTGAKRRIGKPPP